MFLKIINYSVRVIIIIVGILFLSGLIIPPDFDPTFITVVGIVFILFGLYRLITYHSHLQRYERQERRDNDVD